MLGKPTKGGLTVSLLFAAVGIRDPGREELNDFDKVVTMGATKSLSSSEHVEMLPSSTERDMALDVGF